MYVTQDAGRMVEQFVVYFYKHIADGSLKDIETMYTLTFTKISTDFFPDKPWPFPDRISSLVNDDLFWVLYRELYYRHLHGIALRRRELITMEHRKASWDNYLSLFQVLQGHSTSMKLPNLWLWDMVDEFLYQFQSYMPLRGQVSERTEEELEFLAANPNVWHPSVVQHTLESLVSHSDIRSEVSADNGKRISDTDGLMGGESNVLRMLGYFSLVGLCRFHCLAGNHEAALRALAPLNPFIKQNLFTFKIPLANINLYYYAGMSYLMLRRYIDAARCFNTILSYIYRVKSQHRESVSYSQILNKNEQIYHLLAIVVSMCPAAMRWCDDNVVEQLKNKCSEPMNKMQSGSIDAYKAAFSTGCVRFITLADPDLAERKDNAKLGFQTQLRLFISEAEAAHQLPDLKKYLKLYTSVDTEKLAQLLETDSARLMAVLEDMRRRTIQKRWVSGDAVAGQDMHTADVEFRIEKCKETGKDLVVVHEQRIAANHLATLARHVIKFEQITHDMEVHVQQSAMPAAAR